MARVAVWNEYKINMGNYEHVVFGARVEMDELDLDTDPDEALSYARIMAELAVKRQLEEAKDKTVCDESFIHEWEIENAEAVSPSSQQRRRG